LGNKSNGEAIMNKKIISLFTILAFIIFALSCYTTEIAKVNTVISKKEKELKIVGIVKKSGETIKFPKDHPVRIFEHGITGTETMEVEIDKSNVEEISKNANGIILMITKDGKAYHLNSYKEHEDIIVCTIYKVIPFSEVDKILLREGNRGLYTLVTLGVVVGLVLLLKSTGMGAIGGGIGW